MNIKYLYSRLIKKARGTSILGSKVDPSSKVEAGSQFLDSSMAKYSYCGYDCQILHCSIGSFCSIADNVIIGGAKHPIDWVSTSPVFFYGKDSVKKKFSVFQREKYLNTIIGHDVWIGHGAHIKQGVIIGTGAVIGMGAVVTKDVPPYAIVGGNPAKVLRMRFDDSTVSKLLKSEWWAMPEDKLQELSKYIQNPNEFLKHISL